MIALLAALRDEARSGSRRLTPEAGAHLDKILAGVPESTETQTEHAPGASADANAALPEPLTPRELEILRMVAGGASNGRIAKTLWLAEQTVKYHLSNTYRKLGVANRTQASHYAHVHGLLGATADAAVAHEAAA